METHISILGVCASRDVFGTHGNDGGYVVDAYAQNCNPISAVAPSPLRQFLDDGFWSSLEGASPFAKRCLDLDLNKGIFPYFAKRRSDWLVIDFAAVWEPVFRTDEGVGTAFQAQGPLLSLLRAQNFIGEYETYYAADLPRETLYPLMDRYLDRILELYPQERIICLEVRAAPTCLLPGGAGLGTFARREVETVNPLAGELYQYAITRLPRSHRVPFPKGVVGDALHKWGSQMLHFVQDYYDYALEAVRVVTGRQYAPAEEERLILEMKRACEARLAPLQRLPRFDSPPEPVTADVFSVEAERSHPFVGEEVPLIARTDPAAELLSLWAENSRQACAWHRAGNSVLEDGVRVWRVRYTFKNPGERLLHFAAFCNACYGESAALSLFVDHELPFVVSLRAEAAEISAGQRLGVSLATSASAERLALFAEAGNLVRTWDAGKHSGAQGRLRTWEIDFPIAHPGRRALTFRCERNGEYGPPTSLRVNVSAGTKTPDPKPP